ncbi:MAG TPA: TonB-dependent receptor [Fibrobacteria bacterium]|nr:TonB-dependent receptor [Fibrobacteria bacterium]
MSVNIGVSDRSMTFLPIAVLMSISIGFGQSEAPPVEAADSTTPPQKKSVYELNLSEMSLEELGKVRIPPFTIDTRMDKGYRASNSVSGSRFNLPIRELPYALQGFTESFIKDQKPRDIFDIARYSPGVTYRSNDFNEGDANLAIRGFAVSSVAGGNIPVTRDGFHGPTILDFTNVERVEILKGPSSFLYGQVAPGGIVNIISKDPLPEFQAYGDARYGSYDEYHFEADVTGPIVNSLLFRTAASYDQDINYWEPYDAYSYNISPSLLWIPHDRVSVSMKYERFIKDESPQVMQKPGYNTQRGLVPTAADPNLSGVDVPDLPDDWNSMSFGDFRRSETNGFRGWVDVKASDHWDFRVGSSYQDNTIDALFSGNLGMANNTTRLQGRRQRHQEYSNEDVTVETQALGNFDFSFMDLRILTGVQYIERTFERNAAQAPNDTALGSTPTASPLPLWDLSDPSTWNRDIMLPRSTFNQSAFDQTNNYYDKSAYVGATIGFFKDRLLAFLGWRVTSTESDQKNNLKNEIILSDTTTAITPQYGMRYEFTPGLSLFGSYSESFVPGSNILEGNSSTLAEPTLGKGVEFGLKSDLLDGRVSSTLTFFNISNTNIVNDLSTTNATGALTLVHVQSGEQRSRGVEMDATLTPTDNWQVYTSYSYMDARILEFSGRDESILAQDTSTLDAVGRANYKDVKRFHNAPLQMSAPHLANLWTRYNLTQSFLKGAYIAGGINFVYDQTLLPDSPVSSRQTYSLVSATAGYAWVWNDFLISINVHGKNLTDEHYRPSQSSRSRPREILLASTVKF